MSRQPMRLAEGGLIERHRRLAFSFDGRHLEGHPGDSLASALLANGVRLVGRSFKYHRRRGVFSAGPEEPSALVQIADGDRTRANVPATVQELYDGLVARSQNRWPSLGFDVGALAGLAAPLMPAGFYYKTFMWPASMWMTYERLIRRLAGMGVAPRLADPDTYEKRHAHCDVLVVGGGPAGLAAASAAAVAGARVVLADEAPDFGGSLRRGATVIDGAPGLEWARTTVAGLAARPEVTLIRRACVFGYYDDTLLAIDERVADHVAEPDPAQPRGRLWVVRARRVVLAGGAIERPLVFAGNDAPGVMLAGAARAYVNQYAVRPGRRAVVFTNNDGAYDAALDLARAGVEVVAIVDARAAGGGAAERAAGAGITILYGHAVVAARGARRLRGVDVMALTANDGVVGPVRRMGCDLLCVSGGWTPSVHLFSQSGGRLAWDQGIAALVPAETGRAVIAAGAAAGALALHDCLAGGIAAGARAAADAGFDGATAPDVPDCAAEHAAPLRPLWMGPRGPGRRGKRFVDLQNDVTTDDLALAMREGYRSVEHVKRYTTLGMGTDQGRTGNVNGIGVLAVLGNTEPPAIGTIRFRPPYAPVALGTLAGRDTGAHFAPVRRTPMHAWHLDAGAELVTAGLWMRPRAYPRPGESVAQAVAREALAVRTGVGLVDVSTLGKIDIQGRDAALLLDRVYTNGWKSLRVGACRYGLMLRDDGMVFDDGTTSRIAEDRYYMTTTTAGAAEVMRHLEHALQVLWPELDVHLVSVSDPWAGMALAGPNARSVLAAVTEGMNVGAKAFPFLGYRQAVIAGTSVRLFRISYSGELAYEIHAPAERALEVWETVLDAGQPWAMVAYGTEAVGVLRTEKGHVVGGAEIDGRTTAGDLGLGGMLSTEKDFIGRRALERPGLADAGRKQLVGLRPVDGRTAIPAGAQLVAAPNHGEPAPAFGHVTSTAVSPNLGGPIALALLVDGRRRHGETVHAAAPLTGCSVPVTVSHPHFFDPEGERQRG